MKFFSTRDKNRIVDFKRAIFDGLAPDGGLYLPVDYPNMRELFEGFVERAKSIDNHVEFYREIVKEVSLRILTPEVSDEQVKRIANLSVSFSPEVRAIGDRTYLLELFHGPTCAFKDFGASFLASSMEVLLSDEGRRAVILVATSGDTGSAVARAFYGRKNIDVVILYPSGRVSYLQEKQLTTLGKNIVALEVKGTFDDCQRLVKEAFMDRELSEAINLTSANSINLGRLLPQAYYYIFGYAMFLADGWGEKSKDLSVTFCVPSGNFGNLTAGILSWKWGLPVKRFIAATNINDVVPEYLESGIFSPRVSVKTLSNAMDVGNPSNFERLKVIFGDSVVKMRELLLGEAVSDRETLSGIREVYDTSGLLIDPHTAVGYVATKRYIASGNEDMVIILSTAHPGKFSDTVERATGVIPELPPTLKEVLSQEKRSVIIEPDISSLKSFLLKHF